MDTLTKEEVEALPAGPEMDKLIALQVMGYTMYHYDKDVKEACYFMLLDAEGDAVVFRPRYRDGEHATEEKAWADCPAFSTDIAAAWQVVERLAANGYGYCLSAGRATVPPIPNYRWPDCSFHTTFGGPQGDSQAETAPLAICRAALIATLVSSAPAVPEGA